MIRFLGNFILMLISHNGSSVGTYTNDVNTCFVIHNIVTVLRFLRVSHRRTPTLQFDLIRIFH